MAVAAFVIAFLAVGSAVAFVAFSGGPSQARQAYLTRGGRGFRVVLPLIYIACGLAVPALVIAARQGAEGSTGQLADQRGSKEFSRGKLLFRQTCWSCHTLQAAGAKGVTGPNLDEIGTVSKQRVLNAIDVGGTGQGRMPADLSQGQDAEKVAAYVAAVAGR